MDDPPRVADYFLVAGLPTKDPELLDNDSLEVNLRATANQDPITDIAVSIQNCTVLVIFASSEKGCVQVSI